MTSEGNTTSADTVSDLPDKGTVSASDSVLLSDSVGRKWTEILGQSLPALTNETSNLTSLHLKGEQLAQCFRQTSTKASLAWSKSGSSSSSNSSSDTRYRLQGQRGVLEASLQQVFTSVVDAREGKFYILPRYSNLSEHSVCFVAVSVPENHTMWITVSKATEGLWQPALAVRDVLLNDRRWVAADNFVQLRAKTTFVSMSSSVLLRLTFVTADYRLSLQYLAVERTGELEVVKTHHNAGYVQSPLYGDHQQFDLLVAIYMKHVATLKVPSGHLIMTSFPVRLMQGCIDLYLAGVRTRQTSTISLCCQSPPLAEIYQASTVTVQFTTHPKNYCLPVNDVCCSAVVDDYTLHALQGFRMLYSFHQEQEAPRKLSHTLWNCSVPKLPDFGHHLRCNLFVECEDKQDEIGCPYTSTQCGPGAFVADSACFFVARVTPFGAREAAFWVDGTSACQEQGGQMASLKTLSRMQIAMHVLATVATFSSSFIIGLTGPSVTLPRWYVGLNQWTDGSTEFRLLSLRGAHLCAYLMPLTSYEVAMKVCFKPQEIIGDYVLCEIPSKKKSSLTLRFPTTSPGLLNSSHYIRCPSYHVTHSFLACDVKNSCWSRDRNLCTAPLTPLPPSFVCEKWAESVPYSLVCDAKPDCQDGSDEEFCHYPHCSRGHSSCGNGQCVPSPKFCDRWVDCLNGRDESNCQDIILGFDYRPPPAIISILDQSSIMSFHPLVGEQCPETHFQCPKDGYCLPVILRCNGVPDCPYHEDEADCQNFACPGFYRCRHSAVCLHPREVCDGRPHCPQHDDELLCGWDCPRGCLCYGWSFFCAQAVSLSGYSQLRYLDAHGSSITFADINNQPLIVFLNLSLCNIVTFGKLGSDYPNLLTFDLSQNLLASIPSSISTHFPNLQTLLLTSNPLVELLEKGDCQLLTLKTLELSRVSMVEINISRVSAVFPHLHNINLSNSGLTHVMEEGFHPLQQLRVVDLRGCPVEQFSRTVFQGLAHLKEVHADNFKVCCPQILPEDFVVRQCHAPADELSSCEDLLGSAVYFVSVMISCVLAVAGNFTSFVYRSAFSKAKGKKGFGVLVTHLSLADLVMGLYLAILGCMDRIYHGEYLWNDHTWRHSSACYLAGFLSLLSMEVSTLVMCLITIDRFLVLRFPFSGFHLGVRSAHAAALLVWIMGFLLASAPLMVKHWRFFGQTAICIPLPIHRNDFPGRTYSFAIVVVLNFVLFLFVSMGQAVIYWSVQMNALSVNSNKKKTKDLTIARRLISVAMSNFLCWFPIGLLGLLTSRGLPVPREVSVGVAVLVLPLNSALNPFLYTLNVILERRQRAVEDRLKNLIAAQMQAEGACKLYSAQRSTLVR